MKTAKQSKQEIRGTIAHYTINKHQDVDGLVIDHLGEQKEVKFPPHTARFIREVAAEGDTVTLVLEEKHHAPHHDHKHPKQKRYLQSIENTSANRQFKVEAVKPPHPPETGRLVLFTIPKPQFTRGGKHGEITGVIFEGNYIHLHPKEYEVAEEALESAGVIHVKAKKRVDTAGFVNNDGYIVYHAHSLTIG